MLPAGTCFLNVQSEPGGAVRALAAEAAPSRPGRTEEGPAQPLVGLLRSREPALRAPSPRARRLYVEGVCIT